MKKSVLIIGLVVIVSIGYFFFPKTNAAPECLSVEKGYKQTECYIKAASSRKDPTICRNITGDAKTEMINVCYETIAADNNDTSICDTVDWKFTLVGRGRVSCYIEVAKMNKIPALCDREPFIQDPNQRNRCLWEVAIKNKDSSICEGIENKDAKSYCEREALREN